MDLSAQSDPSSTTLATNAAQSFTTVTPGLEMQQRIDGTPGSEEPPLKRQRQIGDSQMTDTQASQEHSKGNPPFNKGNPLNVRPLNPQGNPLETQYAPSKTSQASEGGVSSQAGGNQDEQIAGFTNDSLFRCQRVLEVILQNSYAHHFNQALGQRNLLTVQSWLNRGCSETGFRGPLDVYNVVKRLFAQFDKICPPEHTLKRVCAVLEQQFSATWKQAGLPTIPDGLPSASQSHPSTVSSQINHDARANSAMHTNPSSALQQGVRPDDINQRSQTWGNPGLQSNPIQITRPDQLRSNSPIVSLPAQMQVGSNQGHMGSTNHGQGGQRPGIQSQEQLQRLIADPEVKPNERALLQQLFELRRRRPIAEAAQRQATAAVQRWQMKEQELQMIKMTLAQAKARWQSSGTQAPGNPTSLLVNKPIASQPPLAHPAQGSNVDASCELKSSPVPQKPLPGPQQVKLP